MTLPDQTPKLPKWPFLLIDAVLLGIAALTAAYAPNRFAPVPFVVIVGCVALAAIAIAVPFLADYAHSQDEALDDRQRALDALARTVNTSAEQISIAANGLNEIAELTQKALRHADHLPQKLHEKIAEVQALLTAANDAEKDELEREVAALRTAESDRLEATSDKIAKSTVEWVKLEAATQKHLAAAAESLTKAQTQAANALDTKLAAALAALDAKIAELEAVAKKLAALPPPAPAPGPAVLPPPVATLVATAPADAPAKTEIGTAHPPKRPRKPRREEPAVEEPAPTPESAESIPESKIETPKLEDLSSVALAKEEPPPIPAEKIPEVAPIAPHTAEPFDEVKPVPAVEVAPPAPDAPPAQPEPAASAPAPASEAPKTPRKRAPKKPAPAATAEPAPEPSLGLVEPPAPEPAAEVTERALSSDGATRLLVTAYIGIGNRLFIRGDGPGLSWEKGVPLQFVSIGKWRWETANATAPVQFKLYKNDETECAALGPQTLDPGQQQEVTAAF